ncbi:MAG: hypothetical protein SNJ60_08940 [Pseudanabaenaceae cyanobacterium]
MWAGIKGVDLIAIHEKEVWLIEVKDYREHPRTKTLDLAEEVARKVFDTLAALLPAKIHANEPAEKEFAKHVIQGQSLRVILHLEQPRQHSKLRPRAIDPADVQQKLRQTLKPIDPHPKVRECGRMEGLPWQVSSIRDQT